MNHSRYCRGYAKRASTLSSPLHYASKPTFAGSGKARIGSFIGTIYVGCPTCADDILLMSNYLWELQVMLKDKATLNDSASTMEDLLK